jgi:hypothetical protein
MFAANASSASLARPNFPQMGVEIGPGLTTFTRIPLFASSEEMLRPRSAPPPYSLRKHWLSERGPWLTNEVFRMTEAVSLRNGMASWAVKNTPLTLMSNVSVGGVFGDIAN